MPWLRPDFSNFYSIQILSLKSIYLDEITSAEKLEYFGIFIFLIDQLEEFL